VRKDFRLRWQEGRKINKKPVPKGTGHYPWFHPDSHFARIRQNDSIPITVFPSVITGNRSVHNWSSKAVSISSVLESFQPRLSSLGTVIKCPCPSHHLFRMRFSRIVLVMYVL